MKRIMYLKYLLFLCILSVSEFKVKICNKWKEALTAWNKSELSPLQYQLSLCSKRCNGSIEIPGRSLNQFKCDFCQCARPACEIYDICCPDVSVPIHLTEVTTHLTEASTHLTEAPTHLTEASTHLTEAPTHLTEAPTHLTEVPTANRDTGQFYTSTEKHHDLIKNLKVNQKGNAKIRVECSVEDVSKILFVSSCVPEYNENLTVQDLCLHERPAHLKTLETSFKVIDNITGVVYKNIYCAICNKATQIVTLKRSYIFKNIMSSYTARSVQEVIEIQIRNNDIQVYYEFDKLRHQGVTCLDGETNSPLNIIFSKVEEESLIHACIELKHRSLLVYSLENSAFYQNIFCAIVLPFYDPYLSEDPLDKERCFQLMPHIPDRSFSLLLNFRGGSKQDEDAEGLMFESTLANCSVREWSAPDGRCLELRCTPGKHLKGGKCVEYLPEVKSLYYSFHFSLVVKDEDVDIMAKRFRDEISSTHNLMYLLMTQMEFYIQFLSRLCELQLGVLESQPNTTLWEALTITRTFWVSGRVNALDTLSRSEFETRFLEQFMQREFIFKLSSTSYLSLSPQVLPGVSTQKNLTCISEIKYKPQENLKFKFVKLSGILICMFISFNQSDYKMTINEIAIPPKVNITLDFKVTQIYITDSEDLVMVEINDNGGLDVCIDLIDRKLKEQRSEFKSTNKECEAILCWVEYILTLVCFSISIVCLLVTLLTYLLFSVLRTVAGRNNMFLSCSLLMAQVSLLASLHMYV
nr:putative adhesion G protein-coupled receptor E4P; partial [Biomphalaria glabrata]